MSTVDKMRKKEGKIRVICQAWEIKKRGGIKYSIQFVMVVCEILCFALYLQNTFAFKYHGIQTLKMLVKANSNYS